MHTFIKACCFVFAVTVVSSVVAADSLQPIRAAKVSARVFKYWFEFTDNSSNPVMKKVLVCSKTFDVWVYDKRTQSGRLPYTPEMICPVTYLSEDGLQERQGNLAMSSVVQLRSSDLFDSPNESKLFEVSMGLASCEGVLWMEVNKVSLPLAFGGRVQISAQHTAGAIVVERLRGHDGFVADFSIEDNQER